MRIQEFIQIIINKAVKLGWDQDSLNKEIVKQCRICLLHEEKNGGK